MQHHELAQGDYVYVYREFVQGRNRKPKSAWRGPGVIVGFEGINAWVSMNGRCIVCAREHLRPADSEELGEIFKSEILAKDLEKLLDEMEAEGEDYQMEDWREAKVVVEEEIGRPMNEAETDLLQSHGYEEFMRRWKLRQTGEPKTRHRVKKRPAEEAVATPENSLEQAVEQMVDDELAEDLPFFDDPDEADPEDAALPRRKEPRTAYMLRQKHTAKTIEKQLEKEIPWNMIPKEQGHLFAQAREKQWQEHQKYEAFRNLSMEESEQVRAIVHPSRILRSRYAYRDKNAGLRITDPSVPVRAKARLCCGGHLDPDLPLGTMRTDAPTVSKLGLMVFLNLAGVMRWNLHIGDIEAAFLNGEEAPRNLFMEQPREGFPGMAPGQLVEIIKEQFEMTINIEEML